MPRFDDRLPAEFEISMQLGRLSADEIGVYVRGLAPPKRIRELERVRWFRVGDLRAAGYRVERSPGRGIHVSVWGDVEQSDRGDLAVNKSWWCDSGRARLEALAIGIGGDPK